jgi:Holliday junction resolvase
MIHTKNKGYRVERKVRLLFEKYKWKVIRAGASLGEADLVCFKNGKSIFLQIKSTRKKDFYFYEYMNEKLEGLPFYLVVDFGYGKVRILPPRKKVCKDDGILLKDFLENGCELN